MPKKKKEEDNSGHNSLVNVRSFIERYASLGADITELRGDQKAVLNEAKELGFSKTAIKQAVKELTMTAEQRQALLEVEEAKKDYINVCADLPLFQQAAAREGAANDSEPASQSEDDAAAVGEE